MADILIEIPSVIKRPVVVKNGDASNAVIGYDEAAWQALI